MPLARLDAEVSSGEQTLWQAFDEEYTLPDAYFVAGQLGTAVCAALGNDKANPTHFVPFFRPPEGEAPLQDVSLQRALVRAAAGGAARPPTKPG